MKRSVFASPYVLWMIVFTIMPLVFVVYYAITDTVGSFSDQSIRFRQDVVQSFYGCEAFFEFIGLFCHFGIRHYFICVPKFIDALDLGENLFDLSVTVCSENTFDKSHSEFSVISDGFPPMIF